MRTHKIFRGLIALLLLASAGQSVTAQEAFYVYRNDGDFNGFFYDQVKRMNLSKIDYDGVEHDDYVIQEIETEDSLYRIPLLAIDSIGFQQPEIILNPRLKNMDETGLVQYIDQCSSQNIYLTKDIPRDQVPQPGDVLVTYDNELFNFWGTEDFSGFACKVLVVYDEGDWYNVFVGLLTDLSDIFVQFITTEEVVQNESGQQARRLAGWHPDDAALTRGIQGAGSTSLIDFTLPLKKEFKVGDNGTIGAEVDLSMNVKMAAVYQISMKSFFIKTVVREDCTIGSKIYGKYSGDCEYEIPGLPKLLRSIKFPAVAPLLQTRPLPTAFLRASGEMGAELSLPSVKFTGIQTFIIDNDQKPMMSFHGEVREPEEGPEKGILENTDLSVYFKGAVQIGVKFSANIETNDWIEDLFMAGVSLNLYLGPQVNAELDFKSNLQDIVNGSVNVYKAMKDSYINVTGLAANIEAKGALKLLDQTEDEKFAEKNYNWLEMKWKLFPNFSGNVTYDTARGTINTDVLATDPVFVPTHLGMGVYTFDKETEEYQMVDSKFHNYTYFLSGKLGNDLKFSFDKLPCGRYMLRPLMKTLGYVIPATPTWDVVVTPYIRHGVESTMEDEEVEASEAKAEIPFRTNADNVEVYVIGDDGRPQTPAWQYEVDEKIEDNDIRCLTVYMGKNEVSLPRRWKVVLNAIVKDYWGIVYESCDTVYLKQSAGDAGFKKAEIWVNVKETGGYRKWETNNSDPARNYDEYSPAEGTYSQLGAPNAFDQTGFSNLTCTKTGNIIHCTQKKVWSDFDQVDPLVEEKGDYTYWTSRGERHSHEYLEISFDVDLSSLDNLKVINGLYEKKDIYSGSGFSEYKHWNRDNEIIRHEKGSTEYSGNYYAYYRWDGPMTVVKLTNYEIEFKVKGSNSVSGAVTGKEHSHDTSYERREDVVKIDMVDDINSETNVTVVPDEDNEVFIRLYLK